MKTMLHRLPSSAKTLSPTHLRKSLFQTLRRITRGEVVVVETTDGLVLLTALKRNDEASKGKAKYFSQPKIPGRILASLDSADVALRRHLRLPE